MASPATSQCLRSLFPFLAEPFGHQGESLDGWHSLEPVVQPEQLGQCDWGSGGQA